uniref:Uncharacterized protein n=1 Tax=Steinernema glaseri TaxID=37863 RepID=A0A1I8AA41_9BILA
MYMQMKCGADEQVTTNRRQRDDHVRLSFENNSNALINSVQILLTTAFIELRSNSDITKCTTLTKVFEGEWEGVMRDLTGVVHHELAATLLVQDAITTFSATDGILWFDLIFAVTFSTDVHHTI